MKYVMIILALFFVSCTTNKFDVPTSANSGKTGWAYPHGNSMNIPPVLLVRMEWDEIEIGDIVINHWPGKVTPVIHRVICPGLLSEDGKVLTWMLKGDNNPWHDPWHLWPSTYGGTVVR